MQKSLKKTLLTLSSSLQQAKKPLKLSTTASIALLIGLSGGAHAQEQMNATEQAMKPLQVSSEELKQNSLESSAEQIDAIAIEPVIATPPEDTNNITEPAEDPNTEIFADENIENIPDEQISGHNDFTKIINRPDDEVLIFQLLAGQKIFLSNSLIVYHDYDEKTYHVSLIDILEILEFAIDVDETTAKGWFIREGRQFDLDLERGNVIIDGSTIKLKPKDVQRYYDGIYVSKEALESWFPIILDINFSDLAINLKSLEPLPFEIRRARDQKRKLLDELYQAEEENYVTQSPSLFSIPFIDTSLQGEYDSEDEENTMNLAYTTEFRGIILGQDGHLTINNTTGDNQKPDVRIQLSRQDHNSELLGPLKLSSYLLGDISTKRIPLISRSKAGRGVTFTNNTSDLQIGGLSSTVTLRGELPVGFQVDVMRNGQLQDFIEEPNEDGEYIFEELSVFPGLNIFELVFYGPQGQIRTEEERIFVAANPVKKGEFKYEFSSIQDDKNLFTTRQTGGEDAGELRTSLLAEYGLFDKASVYAGYSEYSLDGDRRTYGLLGSNFSFNGLRFDVSYAKDKDGGSAYGASAQGIFKGIRWTGEHREYNSFTSEDSEEANVIADAKRESSIMASGVLPFFFLRTMPLTIEIERFEDAEKNVRYQRDLRFTRTFKKLRVTTALSQISQTNRDRTTDANIQLSSRLNNNLSLRGDIRYSLEPERALDGISLTADYKIKDKHNLRFGLTRSGAEDPLHSVLVGYSKEFKNFRIGTSVTYDDDQEILALINASFGFAYDARTHTPYFSAKGAAQTGALAAQVFLDNDNDGMLDEDEEYLTDIGFFGPKIDKEARTNEEGYLFLPSLKAFSPQNIGIDTITLSDPSFKDKTGSQEYLLRPSQVFKKNFPVIMVGEIDAMVYGITNGKKEGLSSIIIEVVDELGNVLASAPSEFDGFNIVPEVPFGTHTARINPEQLKELGYCTVETQDFVVTQDEPFVSIEDIILYPSINSLPDQNWLKLGKAASLEDQQAQWDKFVDLLSIEIEGFENLEPIYINNEHNNEKFDILIGPLGNKTSDTICDQTDEYGFICSLVKEFSCDKLENETGTPAEDENTD